MCAARNIDSQVNKTLGGGYASRRLDALPHKVSAARAAQTRAAEVEFARQRKIRLAEEARADEERRLQRPLCRSRRVLIAYLHERAGLGEVSISKSEFMEDLQLSHNTVSAAVRELVKRGYIEVVVSRDPVTNVQLPNRYRLTRRGLDYALSLG